MSERLGSPVPALTAALFLAAGATGVAAGMSAKYAVGAAVGLVFLVVALQDVAIGLCMLAALAIVDGQGSLGVAKLAGGVLAVSWLATILTRRLRRGTFIENQQGLAYALVLLVTWMALTVVWAESQSQAIFEIERYVPNVLMIPIAYDALQERRHVVWLLATVAASAALAALWGLAAPPPDPTSADAGRATGTFGDANEFAAALVVGLPLLMAFALRARTATLARWLAGVGAVVTVGALFLTLSRGGLVALGAGLVAAVVFGGRWRGRVLAAALALLTATVAYFALFASLPARERVTNVGGGGTGRLDLWTIAERMISAHPLRGIGVGNFPVSSIHYLIQPGLIKRSDFIISHPKVAHNTYLQFAAELGLPAAVLFLAIVVFCVVSAARAAAIFARRQDPDTELLIRAVTVSMVSYLAALLFISQGISKLLWLLLALGPALLAVARDGPQVEGNRRR